MKNIQKISFIILVTFFIFFLIIKLLCNDKGDWGDDKLKDIDILYFISTTFSTAGYGDIYPKSNKAKIITLLMHFTILIEVINILSK